MTDRQFPSKRSYSKSRPLPSSSPSKIRRLEPPVSPPDTTKDVESESSPPDSKKQQQQPESALNSTTATPLSQPASAAANIYTSEPPVLVRPVDYTGMSLEERTKLLDRIVERDAGLLQWQREQDQQTEEKFDKMSRAEWEEWRIEFRKKHQISKPTPFPRMTFEEVVESNYYSSDEDGGKE